MEDDDVIEIKEPLTTIIIDDDDYIDAKTLIQSLLATPFHTRTKEERQQILKTGRPTPLLPYLKTKKGNHVLSLLETQYSRYDWLTGCEVTNKLYCWPCLLYGRKEGGTWTCGGFNNLNNLQVSQKKHRKSISHLESLLLFACECERDGTIEEERRSEIKGVIGRRNKEVLRRLIDVVLLLFGRQLSVEENCEESLRLLVPYDKVVKDYFSCAINSSLRVDLIKAIKVGFTEVILEEIKKIELISLVVHKGIYKSNVFVFFLLQYVLNLKTQRRCVMVVNEDASDIITKKIKKIYRDYNLKGKLKAVIYDGKILSETISHDFPEGKILKIYTKNYIKNFIDYGLTHTETFQLLLTNVKKIINFTDESGHTLIEHLSKKLPNLESMWDKSLPKILIITTNIRKTIIDYFTSITNSTTTTEVIRAKAITYSKYLCDQSIILQLKFFSSIFNRMGYLYEDFQSKAYKNLYNIITRACDDSSFDRVSRIINSASFPSKDFRSVINSEELWTRMSIAGNDIQANLTLMQNSLREYKFLDLFDHDFSIFDEDLNQAVKNQYSCLKNLWKQGETLHSWLERKGVVEVFEEIYKLSVKAETFGVDGCCDGWAEVGERLLGCGCCCCEDLMLYFNGGFWEGVRGSREFVDVVCGGLRGGLRDLQV